MRLVVRIALVGAELVKVVVSRGVLPRGHLVSRARTADLTGRRRHGYHGLYLRAAGLRPDCTSAQPNAGRSADARQLQ